MLTRIPIVNRSHPSMGQLRPREDVLRDVQDLENRLLGRPDCDAGGAAMAVIARVKTWVQTAPEGSSYIAEPGTPEYGILKAAADCMARLPEASAIGPLGIPTLGWVVGGLAAVGLLAFVATKT